MTNESHMLTVEGLSFERGDQVFFDKLCLQVRYSSVLQITGENGVGKTTLLRLLAGFLPVTEGAIRVHAPLAWLGHKGGFSERLTVRENLQFMARVYSAGSKPLDEILQLFNLMSHKDCLAMQLSAGQQRRLAFACLLLIGADLWVLDEPLVSLDKKAAEIIQHCILQHIQSGGSVILTTHHEIMWPAKINLQKLHLEANPCV